MPDKARRGTRGDGGAANQAQLNTPMGLALDSAGDLYIADAGNNVVRKVSKSGAISTAAGNGSQGYSGDGGAATAAALDTPEGVTVDPSGLLYIADTFNNRVRVVSLGGTIQTPREPAFPRIPATAERPQRRGCSCPRTSPAIAAGICISPIMATAAFARLHRARFRPWWAATVRRSFSTRPGYHDTAEWPHGVGGGWLRGYFYRRREHRHRQRPRHWRLQNLGSQQRGSCFHRGRQRHRKLLGRWRTGHGGAAQHARQYGIRCVGQPLHRRFRQQPRA